MPTLTELAQQLLTIDHNTYEGKRQVEDIFTINSLLRHVLVNYNYQHDGGSDGWYTENCDGTCTLAVWTNGEVHHRHPGNRSYNFRFAGIKDATEEGCTSRQEAERLAYEKEREERREKLAEQRAREASALAKRDAEMAKFASGTRVSHKGALGTVERIMVSQFNQEKACALVKFDNGAPSKWHGTGALKLAPLVATP